jgi:O-methyltransferase
MVDVRFRLKKLARSALAPLLYRYPPFTLAPERLYLFMHHLIETQTVPGAVVEIGCNLGGSAIIARKMLRRLGMDKSYICIDTFDGFVDAQFVADTARGTPAGDRTMFSGNSRVLVGKIMDQHGCDDRGRRHDATGRRPARSVLSRARRRRFDRAYAGVARAVLAAVGQRRHHPGR